MCICFYTLLHPKYSLVLITNRDEFLSRPTLPADWRGPGNATLCGLDVKGGGTWFGVEKQTGKFALLTNVREEVSTRTRSRGKLVTDWLDSPSSLSLHDHLDNLRKSMDQYAGFNLLAGQIARDGQIQLGFISNRSKHVKHPVVGGLEQIPEFLHDLEKDKEPGVMSNGALACSLDLGSYKELEKSWPKMTIGKTAFHEMLEKHANIDNEASEAEFIDALYGVLDLAYPNLQDKEEVRSSVLVTPFDIIPPSKAWYATRAQTILLVERGTGKCSFIERQAYEQTAEGIPQWSGSRKSWTFNVT